MTDRCSSGIDSVAATYSSDPAKAMITSRRNRQQYPASLLIQRASLLRWLSLSFIRPRVSDPLPANVCNARVHMFHFPN